METHHIPWPTCCVNQSPHTKATHHVAQVIEAIEHQFALILRKAHVFQPLPHRLLQHAAPSCICRQRMPFEQRKNHLACSSGTRRPRCDTATSSLASRAEGSSSNSKAVSRLEWRASARRRAPDIQTKLVMEIPPQALTVMEMRAKADGVWR